MSSWKINRKLRYPTQAKLLKDLRHKKNLSLKKVEDLTGIKMGRYHTMECGYFQVTLAEAVAISKTLGEEILSGDFLFQHQGDFNRLRVE